MLCIHRTLHVNGAIKGMMAVIEFLFSCKATQELRQIAVQLCMRFLHRCLRFPAAACMAPVFFMGHQDALQNSWLSKWRSTTASDFSLKTSRVSVWQLSSQQPKFLFKRQASTRVQVEVESGAIATPNTCLPKHLIRCIRSAKNA